MIIDWWYGNQRNKVNSLDVYFYPESGQYRGNLYIDGKAVADFVTNDSTEIEKSFYKLWKF